MGSRVLVVDDDPVQCRLLEEIVRKAGHACEVAGSGESALVRLSRSDAPLVSAMILDLVMPDLDGMAVLERLGRMPRAVPVIVQTARTSIDAALSAMRAGACDFLVKPATPERVQVSLANALKFGALESELTRMQRSRAGTLGFGDAIMRSPAMERVIELGHRAARSAIPVLIEGEGGVGKELVARAIQGSGARRARPFVAVNCAALPAGQAERILFGSEEHTGKPAGQPVGKLQEAHGGTLFLDEVGALPPEIQARLSTLLQDYDAQAPGRSRAGRADIRLIAATKRRLIDLLADGLFREDLFYRLNILTIWVPPLRERRGDIPELVRHFLARFAAEEGKTGITGVSREALDMLVAYDWPGNIRQLENAMFRAVVLCGRGDLAAQDFPQILASVDPNSARSRIVAAALAVQREDVSGAALPSGANKFTADPTICSGSTDRREQARYGIARLLDERGEMRPFEALEAEVIRFAVDHYGGHMSEVARRLGIGRSTLYRKLKDYGIAAGEAAAS